MSDGSTRTRAYGDELFPAVAASDAPLAAIVLLRGHGGGRGMTPRVQRLPPSRHLLAEITPLHASLWGAPAAARAARLMRLVSAVPCFALEAGAPDDTAEAVVRILVDS